MDKKELCKKISNILVNQSTEACSPNVIEGIVSYLDEKMDENKESSQVTITTRKTIKLNHEAGSYETLVRSDWTEKTPHVVTVEPVIFDPNQPDLFDGNQEAETEE